MGIQLVTSLRGIGGLTYPAYNAQGATLLKGQPVMRRYPLNYVGGVGHTIGAAGLGEFAGILTSQLNTGGLGDISSSRMVYEGEVRATVYVHATPANYIAGAQLAPFWDSVNGSYLKEVSYNTGITLLENWTAKDASTLYSENTGLGAWVEIAPQANVRNGLLHYAWPAALAADADYYKAAQATSNSVVTTVTSFLNSGAADFARNVTILPGGVTADVAAGDYVITGTNIWGDVITETIAIAANASTSQVGAKAFQTITSVVLPVQDGAGATFDIGIGVKFGLGRPFGVTPSVIQARAAGTVEGTAPTTVADPNEVEKNTISFNTAPAATLREALIHAA